MSNSSNIYTIPLQTIPYADKVKDDFAWAKNTAKALIKLADFNSDEYREMDKYLKAAEGTLIESDYRKITNPLNAENPDYTSFPAELENLPLIEPIIKLYLGDMLNRFKVETVIAVNSDIKNDLKNEINIQIEIYYKQLFINNLNKLGIDTGVESKEIDIKAIVEDLVDTFDDKLSVQGQDILDYLYYNLDMDDKCQEYAKYFFSVGRASTFKESKGNDVNYEVIDPRDMWYYNNNVTYGEDKDAAVRILRVSKTQLISKHYDEIQTKTEILEKIERITNVDSLKTFNAVSFNDGSTLITRTNDVDNSNYIIGYHVEWKTFKQEGELLYADPITGEPITTTVNEFYKLDKANGDISIKWSYVEEVWQTYLYGDDLFFSIGPIAEQRNELNTRCRSKLRYNERKTLAKTMAVSSIAKTLYPFQKLTNTANYQFKMVMNKNKDKILLMPLGLIPKGWDMDKFMYYATSLSFAFFDETKDNAGTAINAIKAIDMGLGQYMKEMYSIIQDIKAEAWDAIGMNRQRFGEINSSDGKATTEQALFRSALINAEEFRQLDKFKEKEANGLMDISKVAYIDGKKAAYMTPDGYKKLIDIVGVNHMYSEYGIFAKNNNKEDAKLEYIKSLGLPLLQNNQEFGTVAEVIDSNNFSKIKTIIKRVEKAKKALEAQQFQQNQDSINAKTESDARIASDKLEIEKYKADRLYDMTIDAANIKAGLEIENQASEIAMSEEELALRKEEINNRREELRSKENMNRDNNATKERVAKKKQVSK